jgi:two-component system, OmpR family, sensor kinase
MTSIRRALLWSLLPAVLVLLAVAVLAVLREVRDEIDEVFDAVLVRYAHAAPLAPLPKSTEDEDDDPIEDLVIAVWEGNAREPHFYSSDHAPLVRSASDGLHTVRIAGERWRTYQFVSGEDTIVAAQPLRVRDEASAEIAARIALPMLLIIPLVVLTVLFLVKRGLRPLTRFASELHSRSPNALGSIELQSMPAELLPMANAMNDLLARLSAAQSAQQVFIADAAHELLTPLTALQVQVQMLERARTEERRNQATRDVRTSLERCIALARQLLTLARHSTEQPAEPRRPLRLGDAVRAAVSDVLPKAHLRSIDLGVASETDCTLVGEEKAIQTLLANLLDNAIKYAPSSGRVDVVIGTREGRPVITVSDNGPGIAPAEKPRVFDRFYRSNKVDVEGSGLGLAIAREIADRHDATIELHTPGRLGGLDVEVVFAAEAHRAEHEPGEMRST